MPGKRTLKLLTYYEKIGCHIPPHWIISQYFVPPGALAAMFLFWIARHGAWNNRIKLRGQTKYYEINNIAIFFLSDTTICNNLQFFSSKNYLFYRYKFILFENCASNLIYVLNLLFFWQNFDRYLSFHLISDNLASPIFFFAYKLTIKYIIQFQITIEYRWIINPWSLVIDL